MALKRTRSGAAYNQVGMIQVPTTRVEEPLVTMEEEPLQVGSLGPKLFKFLTLHTRP